MWPLPPRESLGLELEHFGIVCTVYDKDSRVVKRLDSYRADKTDVFSMQIRLEDRKPWTLALLRKSGEVYGLPAAMALTCEPPRPIWIETDPLVSVDIFMVDPLAIDTISVSKYLRFIDRPSNVTYDISYPMRHTWGEDPWIDFTLGLRRTEAFPESAYFFGEAHFSSGRILESPDTPEYSFQ